MHASVSEICLSLQLSVKVKGCMILLLRRLVQKSRLKMWLVDTSEMVDMDMLCKTYLIEANQTISARKDLMLRGPLSSTPCPSLCMQVTTMASCIELVLMFTLFWMHVISLAFWIELNLIFTFFCMQVITMCSVMSWTLYSTSSACRWPPWRSGGICSSPSSACRWPSWRFGLSRT